MTDVLQQAFDALQMAHTGLMWYRGLLPDYVDGSDGEADEEIQAALSALHAALQQPEPEWVARVVSSGPHNFPLLEWRSANHSLETAIGAKLYVAPPATEEDPS